MRQKLKYQDCIGFLLVVFIAMSHIVSYVTKIAMKNTDKKTGQIGILINASSLRLRDYVPNHSLT